MSTSQPQHASGARLWIEPNETSSTGETDVVLAPSPDGVWSGRIPSQLLGPSGAFLYRLALITPPGAIWTLQLVDDETSRALASDSDVVDGCKTRIVGSASRSRPISERARPRA